MQGHFSRQQPGQTGCNCDTGLDICKLRRIGGDSIIEEDRAGDSIN